MKKENGRKIMKEYYRQKALEEMAKEKLDIEKIKDALTKEKELLEILKQDEKVRAYIKAEEEKRKLEQSYQQTITLMKQQLEGLYLKCSHDIWFYMGEEVEMLSDMLLRKYNNKKIIFHKYKCLECGLEIKRKDKTAFQNENIVLQPEDKSIDNYDYYKELFLSLLCKNETPKSIQIIMQQPLHQTLILK